MTTATEVKQQIAIRQDLTPPPQYRVIFLNDNVTTVDFVMEMLITLFNYETMEAKALTIVIHDEGAATVAIMPFEIAEQKAVEVTALARSNGFPLNVKLEPTT